MVFRPRDQGFLGAASGAVPDQVTGQSSSATDIDSITVSWNAVTAIPAVTSYTIEWSANGSSGWAEIAESPTASTSVADGSLSTYTLYYYRIKANNPMGSGDYSATTSATTDGIIPDVPTGLAVAVSSPDLVISWNAGAGGNPAVYTYTVQRSTSSGSGYSDLSGAVGISGTSHTDDTVSMGTTYYYKVKATNAFGSSAYTSYASGNVPNPTWSAKTDYPADVRLAGCAGASGNSLLYIGGNGVSVLQLTTSTLWNGSTWTAKNTLSTGRAYNAGCGASSSGASAVSGTTTGWNNTGILEQFDGTNWSSPSGGSDTALRNICAAGQSTSSIIRFGGYESTNSTSIWNGSAWSSSGNMGRNQWYGTGCGSGSSALETGGSEDGGVEYSTTTEKFTSGTWSSAAVNTAGAMKKGGSAGVNSDIIVFGGFGTPGGGSEALFTATIQYSSSGDSWSTKNSMSAGVWGGMTGGAGSTTSALWATSSSSAGGMRENVYQYG